MLNRKMFFVLSLFVAIVGIAIAMNIGGQHKSQLTQQLPVVARSDIRQPSFSTKIPAINAGEVPSQEEHKIISQIKSIHVPFIFNHGQADEKVKFYANTFGGTVFVTKNGEIVYSLSGSIQQPAISNQITEGKKQLKEQGFALKESLVGAKVNEVKGEGESVAKVSYFKGNDPAKWRNGIPTFEVADLGEVYDGIELKLKAYGNNVEKFFYLKPEASPELIRVNIEGAKDLKVNESGELVAETEHGDIKFTKPVAYQEKTAVSGRHSAFSNKSYDDIADKSRQYIEVAYVVNGNEYGFKVGEYDRSKELILDPLLASTFLGGRGIDMIRSMAIDQSGNIYVAGAATSHDFPVTTGAYDVVFSGYHNLFISKLNGDLTSLLSSTFIGVGMEYPWSIAMAVGPDGSIFLAGKTTSPDFPVTKNVYDAVFKSNSIYNAPNIFISRLSSDLTTLVASTFFGGTQDDTVNALVLDASGNVYVGGKTSSLDFPTTTGAYDAEFNGYNTPFISKLSGDLTTLLASTFLRGGTSSGNSGNGITSMSIGRDGDIYVAGSTASPKFPTTEGAYSTSFNGGESDVFVSKLNANLTALLASTFLGGKITDSYSSYGYGNDSAAAMALDSNGNVCIAGLTGSPDFPTTNGAYNASFNGSGSNVFVSKLNGDLTALVASTFLGGSGNDRPYSIGINAKDQVYVAGLAGSPDFPVTSNAYDTTAGHERPFVSKFNADLSLLLASTFIGSSSSYFKSSMAIDKVSNVYVAGATESYDLPVTPGAYDAIGNNHPVCINSSRPSTLDDIKITVYGLGPSCGVNASSSHVISGQDIRIDVTQKPIDGGQYACLAIVTYPSITEEVGKLPAGEYNVTVYQNKQLFISGKFKVEDIPQSTQVDCLSNRFSGFSDGFISKLDPNLSSDKGDSGVAISPLALDFETVAIGKSAARDITVTNVSDSVIALSSVTITGTDSGEFSQTGACQELAPGATCKITAAFSPKSKGVKNAKLSMALSGVGSPVEISLAGTGQQMYTLTIMKIGSGSGNVFGTGFNCSDAVPCTQTFVEGTWVKIIAGADKDSRFEKWEGACTVKKNCSLKMDADKTVEATFTKPGPVISVSTAALNFRKVKVSAISGKKRLVIKNTGKEALTITGISADSSEFYLGNWSGQVTILPNRSFTLQVFLVPTSAGQKTSTLTITSNDPKSQVKTISLRGNANGEAVQNQFAGHYTGTYSGAFEGALSFLISADGKVVAKISQSFIGTGTVTPTGKIRISSTIIGESRPFSGTIGNKDGKLMVSGAWSQCPNCSSCGTPCGGGTWTAQKD